MRVDTSSAKLVLVALVLVGLAGSLGAGSTFAAFSDTHDGTGSVTAVSDFGSGGPTANAGGPYTVDEGASTTLDGTTSSASQGSIQRYDWQITSGPGTLSGAATATPTYTAPSNVDADTAVTVRLTVEDNKGNTDSDTATVTVRDVGGADAPAVDSVTVTKTGNQNRQFAVSADLSDPVGDGDQLKNVTIEYISTKKDTIVDSRQIVSISGDTASVSDTSDKFPKNKQYDIVITVYDTVGGDSGRAVTTRTAG